MQCTTVVKGRVPSKFSEQKSIWADGTVGQWVAEMRENSYVQDFFLHDPVHKPLLRFLNAPLRNKDCSFLGSEQCRLSCVRLLSKVLESHQTYRRVWWECSVRKMRDWKSAARASSHLLCCVTEMARELFVDNFRSGWDRMMPTKRAGFVYFIFDKGS